MVFIRVVGLFTVWHLLLACADDVGERRERHQEEFLKDLIEGFGLPPSELGHKRHYGSPAKYPTWSASAFPTTQQASITRQPSVPPTWYQQITTAPSEEPTAEPTAEPTLYPTAPTASVPTASFPTANQPSWWTGPPSSGNDPKAKPKPPPPRRMDSTDGAELEAFLRTLARGFSKKHNICAGPHPPVGCYGYPTKYPTWVAATAFPTTQQASITRQPSMPPTWYQQITTAPSEEPTAEPTAEPTPLPSEKPSLFPTAPTASFPTANQPSWWTSPPNGGRDPPPQTGTGFDPKAKPKPPPLRHLRALQEQAAPDEE